jgi:uncharacterized protein YggE
MTYLDEKYTTAVTKTVLALLLIVTFFFVVMSVNQIRQGAYIGQSQDVQNTISVNGTGEATAIPDSARFTVGVRNEAETVEVAQAQSAETINEIIDYLQEAGVEEKYIKTINYNISPRYEYNNTRIGVPRGERELVGYEVIQNLEITVNDTEQAGELLSGVGSRGADNVSSLQFVVEDEESVQREALVNAIADARENAEELAKALGVSLDKIVGYNELGGVSPMYRMEQSAMANDAGMGGASPQIPIGENRIQTGVQVIYKIR